MNGYGPLTDGGVALLVGALVVPAAVGGAVLHAKPAIWMRCVAWAIFLAALVGGAALTASERAGNRMLLLCAALLFAMKLVVLAEARLCARAVPTPSRWLAFHFLWPGMRPWAFADADVGARGVARWGARRLVVEGAIRIAVGVLLFAAARALGVAGSRRLPSIALALVGLSLAAHFGFFRGLCGFWRSRGVAVVPLFDAPHRSRSLSEFWGRRWNRAFSEMAQIAVHRPLAARLGTTVATIAVFLFSALLHEMALSVPARGGYGLPSIYFAAHGALTLVEGRARWGTYSTLAAVLLPLPLLAHEPFLQGCIVPLLESL